MSVNEIILKKLEKAFTDGNALESGGLLFTVKSIVYKNHTIPSKALLQYFYELLANKQFNFNEYQRVNYLIITLYYLSVYEHDKKKYLKQFVVPSFDDTHDLLYTMYNLIELEDDYDNNNIETISKLRTLLGKYATQPKELDEFLLFEYYHTIIAIRLFDLEDADVALNRVVNFFYEKLSEREMNSSFYSYLRVKMNILAWRIQCARKQSGMNVSYNNNMKSLLSMSERERNFNLYNDAKEIYNMFKSDNNTIHSIKMSILIFDASTECLREDECVALLEESYKLYKDKRMLGEIPYNGKYLEIILQIFSRLSKYYIVNADWKQSERIMKKVNKILSTIQKENDVDKELVLKYSFLTVILSVIIKGDYNFTDKQSTIQQYYDSLSKSGAMDKCNLINYYAMNKYGTIYTNEFYKFIMVVQKGLQNKTPFPKEQYNEYFFSIGCYISGLTQTIVNDNSSTQRHNNLEKVKGFTNLTINHIVDALSSPSSDKQYMLMFLNKKYNQQLVIQLFYVKVYYFFINRKYADAKATLRSIDSFNQTVNLKSNSEYGIIMKLKGDIEFKLNNYNEAKKHYESALEYFNNVPHKLKHRSITLYSLGIIHLFNNDTNTAKSNFNSALNDLFKLQWESKNKEIDNKINIIRNTLKIIN